MEVQTGQTELFKTTLYRSTNGEPYVPIWHNTISLPKEEVKKREQKANGQNVKILAFFAANPSLEFTPFEVNKAFPLYPITSIRRAITDLTKTGYLEKTSITRKGNYDEKNHTWRLKQISA